MHLSSKFLLGTAYTPVPFLTAFVCTFPPRPRMAFAFHGSPHDSRARGIACLRRGAARSHSLRREGLELAVWIDDESKQSLDCVSKALRLRATYVNSGATVGLVEM